MEVLDYAKAQAHAGGGGGGGGGAHGGGALALLPPDFKSWHDDAFPALGADALRMVSRDEVEKLREEVSSSCALSPYNAQSESESSKIIIIILEGFLLYHRVDILQRLDCALFLRLSKSEAKRRRMSRPGYGAEAQGGEFWKTEEYFEECVWRNYVRVHAGLFEGGGCGEGEGDRGERERKGEGDCGVGC